MNLVRAVRRRGRAVVASSGLGPVVRRLLARPHRWWRARSRPQARVTMAVVAAVSLACGAGAGAVLTSGLGGADDVPTAGVGPALPDATLMGPLAVVLPEALGPWNEVTEPRLGAVRDAAADQGVVLDGVWGRIAPEEVVVTVLAAPSGTHGGVRSVSGPFEGEAVDLVWRGGEHRAGVSTDDGVVEAVLVVEAPDGHLVVLSVSGPVGALSRDEALDVLRTVRLPR